MAMSKTLFGRRVYINGIQDKKALCAVPGAERAAINAPLQGTAADIMKRAMIWVGPALVEAGPVLQNCCCQKCMTNSRAFEVPVKAELEATAKLVKQVMQDAPLPAIKLPKVPNHCRIRGHAKNWARSALNADYIK